MKYRHNWELVLPTGMYDNLHHCTICNSSNMESIDNTSSINPEYGCIPPKEQEHTRLIPLVADTGFVDLPNGCTLYWERNEAGGRTYMSDEIGPAMTVWDTALMDDSTLLAALTQEATLRRLERYWAEKRERNKSK